MRFFDRLLTIVITATLVSAGWIVFGSTLFERDGVLARTQIEDDPASNVEPAAGEPAASGAISEAVAEAAEAAPPLDTEAVDAPSAAQTATLVVPVLNVKRSDLVDSFRDERAGGERLHEAIDIMADEGTTVVAAAPGTIEKLFRSEAGGNTIYVRSDDRETIHYYAHLRKYAEGIREGQKVRRGQRLGEVGSSGNADADAPHLHFAILRTTPTAEWWEPAHAINPYPVLKRQ